MVFNLHHLTSMARGVSLPPKSEALA